MRSFECSSPSELDRKFFEEQSLLSALSLEQLSTSRVSNDTVADGSDARLSILASFCLSSDVGSPSQAYSMSGLNAQDTDNCHLVVPLQGMSSTPQVLLQKPKGAAFFDQLNNDLSASQMSWDVSLIKPESNSPKLFVESSAMEQTWSPKPQTSQHSDAEVSPWGGQECPSTTRIMVTHRFGKKGYEWYMTASALTHASRTKDFGINTGCTCEGKELSVVVYFDRSFALAKTAKPCSIFPFVFQDPCVRLNAKNTTP